MLAVQSGFLIKLMMLLIQFHVLVKVDPHTCGHLKAVCPLPGMTKEQKRSSWWKSMMCYKEGCTTDNLGMFWFDQVALKCSQHRSARCVLK